MRIPTIATLLAPALLACAVAGCGVLYKQPIYQGSLLDKAAVDQLQPGMSMEQVMALVGTPSITDPFHQQRWDYTATQRTGRTGGDTEVKTLTLHFENDSLARWEGDYFPEQDEALARQMRKFGNLPKEKKGR